MPDQLFERNSLSRNAYGVWINPDDDSDFDYSDGSEEEQYLTSVLEPAEDLSLDSPELQRAIRDWVSAYHLSSRRTNLLRDIRFPQAARVLEVGCGCGAISRYLGEQGFEVHAIEGSKPRARIARLRTRDLPNVHIIQHNFNTLELPAAGYDAVLFIGVLEYAARFMDQSMPSEQAVQSLLRRAVRVLADTGFIVTAIENRRGLKYRKGCYEDHLAKAYVGIEDYKGVEFSGIKTFDHEQWLLLLDECGLAARFFYPFPDYKQPALVINGEPTDWQVRYLASQIESTDPISNWVMPVREENEWIKIMADGALAQYANSFGVLISRHEQVLEASTGCRWRLYDPARIKPGLRLDLEEIQVKTNKNNRIHRIFNKPDKSFQSLQGHWLDQLLDAPKPDSLYKLAGQLYGLAGQQWPGDQLTELSQIFVDNDFQKLAIAKSWVVESPASSAQALFHLLLEFCLGRKKHLARIKGCGFQSINGIIQRCFEHAGLDYNQLCAGLAAAEQAFRQQVLVTPGSVEEDLATLVSPYNQFQFNHVWPQLFWAQAPNGFDPGHSHAQVLKQNGALQTLVFTGFEANHNHFRLDPADHRFGNGHVFCIHQLRLLAPTGKSCADLAANPAWPGAMTVSGLNVIDAGKRIYRIDGIDPQLHFCLPDDLKTSSGGYNLELKIQWLGVPDS